MATEAMAAFSPTISTRPSRPPPAEALCWECSSLAGLPSKWQLKIACIRLERAAHADSDLRLSAFGRRRMYGIELIIITIGTFGCALASPSPTISAAGLLIFWRVLMVWKQSHFSLSFYPILYGMTTTNAAPGSRYRWRLSTFQRHHFRVWALSESFASVGIITNSRLGLRRHAGVGP